MVQPQLYSFNDPSWSPVVTSVTVAFAQDPILTVETCRNLFSLCLVVWRLTQSAAARGGTAAGAGPTELCAMNLSLGSTSIWSIHDRCFATRVWKRPIKILRGGPFWYSHCSIYLGLLWDCVCVCLYMFVKSKTVLIWFVELWAIANLRWTKLQTYFDVHSFLSSLYFIQEDDHNSLFCGQAGQTPKSSRHSKNKVPKKIAR